MPFEAAGADLDQKSDRGCTPAYIAAQENSADCLRLLIAAGADINRADFDSRSPR